MADWLDTGAAEQIWRPTWARGGYNRRRLAVVAVGSDRERALHALRLLHGFLS